MLRLARFNELDASYDELAANRHGTAENIVTDGLKSYTASMRELGNDQRQEVGRYANNRDENSHLPFR